MSSRGALFREIHKNTWLRRLTADGKKVTVGPKKSDRSWVVFCVHDDTEALLEGYSEPRLAPSHNPEWVISLQCIQHISHALVPNEHEYEFVVTLSDEVIRFHAISWGVMQEWVDTLRSKLREMKILSPRENLYTKLPEIRAPLLPTRDPTSPLPATPPVPAALVPGVERVVPLSASSAPTAAVVSSSATSDVQPEQLRTETTSNNSHNNVLSLPSTSATPVTTNFASMSNTLTQNLLNMLSDPISNYSVQLNESIADEDNQSDSASSDADDFVLPSTSSLLKIGANLGANLPLSLARTFTNNVLGDPKTGPSSLHLNATNNSSSNGENSIRVDVLATAEESQSRAEATAETGLAKITLNELKYGSRPPASRSLSLNEVSSRNTSNITTNNNITEFDIQNNITERKTDEPNESTTNITIIQVSNPLPIPSSGPEIFKFPETIVATLSPAATAEEYKSNVQIIPSSLNTIPINSNNISNQYSSPKKTIQESNKITKVHVSGSNRTGNTYGTVCPSSSSTPKLSKKIILSTNTSGVTNIAVNNEVGQKHEHYEKVFLTSSIPIGSQASPKLSRKPPPPPTSQNDSTAGLKNKNLNVTTTSSSTQTPVASTSTATISPIHALLRISSPAVQRKRLGRENLPPRPLLTRGLTEAVITARPSRIDLSKAKQQSSNNNGELPHSLIERTRSESLEQRRRSSSTSDAQQRVRVNNNEINRTRMQQPPQPFRLTQDNALSQSSKRLTLREQQVLQLRREIMHPGGVRLQLRRKDCLSSIACIDAFGGVWVAGWKQKEHPVLYNALHIGDQLISIAGIAISSAAEANKVIRNANTLFVEILIRRIPFGRVYAIRRDREGQCLGLIRDGNSATIVDVVPNSIAARHGLPPKAQSCDGTTLTFWILTEINGRPLNLFFKENEIRDRLNSVGRDISILVQPSDLVTKLRKQLKSFRSHKDYIVQ